MMPHTETIWTCPRCAKKLGLLLASIGLLAGMFICLAIAVALAGA
jgi:hypothetical protein